VAALALAFVLGSIGTAAALCGDADDDGEVTDVDGVNALRAAAQLSSLCTLETCDVNADGMITDTDGVLILRKAAQLPITGACIPTGGPVDQRVAILVQRTSPFLEKAFEHVPQISDPVSSDIISCDNSFDDGEIEITVDEGETTVDYLDCELLDTLFAGTVEDLQDGLFVDVNVFDESSDDDISFSNENQILTTDSGTTLRLSGDLDASSTFNAIVVEDISDFILDLNGLEVAGNGNLVAGNARLNLSDAEITLLEIVIEYDGSNLAIVTARFDDLSTEQYLFDRLQNRFL
jgi:hypothetical protein